MENNIKGRLIAIEGGDSTGKSTITRMLVDRINKDFLFQRSPRQAAKMVFPDRKTVTGAAIDKHLKKEIYTAAVHPWTAAVSKAPEDAMIFQCMMVVNTYEVATEISALLDAGWDVICDRYTASGIVYGLQDGLSLEWLKRIHSSLPQADLNILLHTPLDVALERQVGYRDRYESDLKHREAVLDRYHALWNSEGKKDPSSWVKVPSLGTIDDVLDDVFTAYKNLGG